MSQPKTIRRFQLWMLLSSVAVILGLAGIGAWLWLQQAMRWLPDPRSEAGKDLLYTYSRTSHDIVLALLAIAVLSLLWTGLRSETPTKDADPPSHKRRSWSQQLITFAREHPLVLLLWTAYTVAMVNGTSWLFPELVAWYDGIIDHHLLDNFSIRYEFIAETMLRNDYRFFPLAHQDLHLLSWFTPYVKVWMLVSAAEAFTIVILATRTVRGLVGRPTPRHLLLLVSLLFLFAPATGFGFFQLIYAERMLTLCFVAFAFFYCRYQESGHRQAWCFSLLFALVGLFFKDISVLLFITPAAFTLVAGAAGRLERYPAFPSGQLSRQRLREWLSSYSLELWLISLLVVFALAYTYLSFLPSIYHGKQAYGSDDGFRFLGDLRCWILFAFIGLRIALISSRRCGANLLDGLNAAALVYMAALYAAVGYEGSSYLGLPVQLVTVLDLSFAWCAWIAPVLSQRLSSPAALSLVAVTASAGLIGLEQQQHDGFLQRVDQIKIKQQTWLKTFNKIDALTAQAKRRGEEVNLIFTKSWFRRKRHLDRFKVDRLIFLDPEAGTYTTVDGIRPGETYTPKPGDVLISIDRGNLNFLGAELDRYDQVYRARPGGSARIFRYRGAGKSAPAGSSVAE